MSDDPQDQLHELLETLLDYRIERDLALERGNARLARHAEGLIRKQHVLVRGHCARWRLPLPADVPAEE